jgi:hypothetical protein
MQFFARASSASANAGVPWTLATAIKEVTSKRRQAPDVEDLIEVTAACRLLT